MLLKLDTVNQAQMRRGAASGFLVRSGTITMEVGDLPSTVPDPYTLAKGLVTSGMPQIGDKYNTDPAADIGDYTRWIVYDYDIRPSGRGPQVLTVLIIYRWLGPLQIRDATSLSSEQTETFNDSALGIHLPIYAQWTNPSNSNQTSVRIANTSVFQPLRHLTAKKTIAFTARATVLAALKSVNNATWEGLPIGYWLVSDMIGETLDQGLTYTYTVTWSTHQDRDWSVYEFLRDPSGMPVRIDPTELASLVGGDYFYGITHANGAVRVGHYKLADFSTIFGNPSADLLTP